MPNEIDYEARKQRRLRALGTDTPVCVICGCPDWQCLELHHIAGQAHHGDLAIVCRNCHRRLSDAQRDHPKVRSRESTIGRFLIGLADMLGPLSGRLKEFGTALIQDEHAKEHDETGDRTS